METSAMLITTAVVTAAGLAFTAATFTIGRTGDHTLRLVAGVGIPLTALSALTFFDITDPLTIALALILFALGACIRTLREQFDAHRRQRREAVERNINRIKEEINNIDRQFTNTIIK